MLIRFESHIDVDADITMYKISIDNLAFADITYKGAQGDIKFLEATKTMAIDRCMKILAAAWEEFEHRDTWSDFEFERDL